MKVTSTGDDLFLLEPETGQDADFLSALDMNRFAKVVRHERQLDIEDKFSVDSAVVSTKFDSANHLLQTLLKLQSLMFAQPHDQGHVGADAVDPHAQERALAIIKKLNVVLDALGAPVQQAEAVQVVAESHAVPCAEKAIIGTVQRLATDDTEGGAA